MKIKPFRTAVQILFVALIAYVGLRHVIVGGGPQGAPPLCSYCPFGGVATAHSYLATGAFLRKTHVTSLLVLGAVLATTLLTGAFCGWMCPFGAVQEWMKDLTNRVQFLRKQTMPDTLDRFLRYGRFVVLLVVLSSTINYGFLVFEKYDPFKNFFHFRMQGTWPWTLFGLTIGLSLLIHRWFCKYLYY